MTKRGRTPRPPARLEGLKLDPRLKQQLRLDDNLREWLNSPEQRKASEHARKLAAELPPEEEATTAPSDEAPQAAPPSRGPRKKLTQEQIDAGRQAVRDARDDPEKLRMVKARLRRTLVAVSDDTIARYIFHPVLGKRPKRPKPHK